MDTTSSQSFGPDPAVATGKILPPPPPAVIKATAVSSSSQGRPAPPSKADSQTDNMAKPQVDGTTSPSEGIFAQARESEGINTASTEPKIQDTNKRNRAGSGPNEEGEAANKKKKQ